jgi:hypothetical protein
MTHDEAADCVREALSRYGSLPSLMIDAEVLRALLDGYDAALELIHMFIYQYSECHLCSAGCPDDEDVDRCEKNAKWRGPAPGREKE